MDIRVPARSNRSFVQDLAGLLRSSGTPMKKPDQAENAGHAELDAEPQVEPAANEGHGEVQELKEEPHDEKAQRDGDGEDEEEEEELEQVKCPASMMAPCQHGCALCNGKGYLLQKKGAGPVPMLHEQTGPHTKRNVNPKIGEDVQLWWRRRGQKDDYKRPRDLSIATGVNLAEGFDRF